MLRSSTQIHNAFFRHRPAVSRIQETSGVLLPLTIRERSKLHPGTFAQVSESRPAATPGASSTTDTLTVCGEEPAIDRKLS